MRVRILVYEDLLSAYMHRPVR